MNDSCTSCHGPRPIDVQALDHDGWTNMVDSMVEKGAQVKSEDAPILIDYLVRRHGPLPDGAGKPIVLNICTQCHDLLRVRRQRTTADGWEDTLEAMLNEGAPLSDQDFSVVLRYLARNFGPEQ